MSYRTFKLSEPEASTVHRVLSGQVTVPGAGKNTSWVTVTRVGSFTDPRYGRFEITPTMLSSMVKNFDRKVYGQEIFLVLIPLKSGKFLNPCRIAMFASYSVLIPLKSGKFLNRSLQN